MVTDQDDSSFCLTRFDRNQLSVAQATPLFNWVNLPAMIPLFPHLIQVIRVFLNYLLLPASTDTSSPEEFYTLLDRAACYFHGLNVALQSPQTLEHSKSAGLMITCPKIYLWAVKFLQHFDANLPISTLVVSATTVRIVELLSTLSADPDYCEKM